MYVNTPRYLFRKFCTLRLIRNLTKGKTLDIGLGAGDMCRTLFLNGYDVKGIDYSPEAIDLARSYLNDLLPNDKLKIEHQDFHIMAGQFDLIIMCEVLEHIEDDQAALEKVYGLLKPGGHLILSVPAHSPKFSSLDEFAGHFRRYDKIPLLQLFEDCRYSIKNIWCYGFPLITFTEWFRMKFLTQHYQMQQDGKETQTKKSGIDKNFEKKFQFLFKGLFLIPFFYLQIPFFHTELGSGYIVKAQKPTE